MRGCENEGPHIFSCLFNASVSEHANVTQRVCRTGRVISMSGPELFSLLLMSKSHFLTFGSRFDHDVGFQRRSHRYERLASRLLLSKARRLQF